MGKPKLRLVKVIEKPKAKGQARKRTSKSNPPPPRPLIHLQWLVFNLKAISPLTPPGLLWEFKKVFYSAAALMLGTMTEIEKRAPNEMMRAAVVLTLFDELNEFDREVVRRDTR